MDLFALLVLLIGNLADAVSTYFASRAMGIDGETNPVIRGFMHTIGVIPTMIVKIIFFSFIGVLIFNTEYGWINLLIGAPYALAAYNNIQKTRRAKRALLRRLSTGGSL